MSDAPKRQPRKDHRQSPAASQPAWARWALSVLKRLTKLVERLAGIEPPPATPPPADKMALVPEDKAAHEILERLTLTPTSLEKALFRGWQLPLLILSPLPLLFVIGLVLDVQQYFTVWRELGTPFRLVHASLAYNDPIYTSLVLTLAVISWLYTRYVQTVPSTLRELWKDEMLLTKRSEVQASDELSVSARFLRRYEASLHSPWRLVVIVGLTIVVEAIFLSFLVQSPGLSLGSFADTLDTLCNVGKWLVSPALWMPLILDAAWMVLWTAVFLRQLTNHFDLKVIPGHGDKCGGLKPLGDICLQMAAMVIIGAVVGGYWGIATRWLSQAESAHPALETLVRPPQQAITGTFLTMATVGGVIVGTWAFFYPLLGIHDDMKKQKAWFAQRLGATAAKLKQELEAALDTQDLDAIEAARAKLDKLQKAYTVPQSYPQWPIDRSIFLKFLTPQLFSVLALLIQNNARWLDGIQKVLQWLGILGSSG